MKQEFLVETNVSRAGLFSLFSIRKLILFIILFLIIYTIKIGIIQSDLLIVTILSIIILMVNNLRLPVTIIFSILFLFLFYTFMLFLFAGIDNFSENGYYFFRILRSTLLYYIVYSVVVKTKINDLELIRVLFSIISLHIIVLFMQQYSDGSIRSFFIGLNYSEDFNTDQSDVVNSIRARGLFGGFDIAGIMSALWFWLGTLIFKKKYWIVLFPISMLSVIISSRVGIISLFYFLFTVALIGFINTQYKITYILKVLLSLLLIILSFWFVAEKYSSIETIQRAFEIYYNYIEYGSFSTSSSDDLLMNHYHIPEEIKLVFVGEPFHNGVSNKYSTDVGFIQLWHNFGLIPMILFLLIISMYVVIVAINNNYSFGYIPLLLWVLILILSLKGPYFFGRGLFDTFIISLAYINAYQELNRHEK